MKVDTRRTTASIAQNLEIFDASNNSLLGLPNSDLSTFSLDNSPPSPGHNALNPGFSLPNSSKQHGLRLHGLNNYGLASQEELLSPPKLEASSFHRFSSS